MHVSISSSRHSLSVHSSSSLSSSRVFLQQSSWVIQVELAIGPEEGISYLTDKGSTVSLHDDQISAGWMETN